MINILKITLNKLMPMAAPCEDMMRFVYMNHAAHA